MIDWRKIKAVRDTAQELLASIDAGMADPMGKRLLERFVPINTLRFQIEEIGFPQGDRETFDLAKVMDVTELDYSVIFERIAAGTFPAPVIEQPGPEWFPRDLQIWQEDV